MDKCFRDGEENDLEFSVLYHHLYAYQVAPESRRQNK